jgi:hypothetical protein
MPNEKKEKKVRTPRNPQSILKGILSLPLEDKVAICKELKSNIEFDVKEQTVAAAKAGELIKGL